MFLQVSSIDLIRLNFSAPPHPNSPPDGQCPDKRRPQALRGSSVWEFYTVGAGLIHRVCGRRLLHPGLHGSDGSLHLRPLHPLTGLNNAS